MKRKILVADLLCGAGGSSTGCARALAELGLDMELVCVNHWPTAIETHRRNHPEARHYVQDIATVRPHLIVPEGYLDLLMASPTCTHHSVARGGKPTSDQQRSDPWHIVTWLTELRVKRLIIENVWEFTGWGPVDAKTGKPVKTRKGEYFAAWIDTLRRLGFEPEWRKLNAANYGDATTRQRFILKARNDKRPVGWAPITHQKKTDDLALFPSVKPWRPAREIIDWNIKGKSIFARKKPLAPKTLARIYAGAVKFHWPDPFLVILRNHMDGRSIDEPVPAIAAEGNHIALAEPVIVRTNMHGRKSPGARGAQDPLMTITTDGGIGVAEPLIVNGRKGNQAKPVSTDPVPTLDTKGGVWLAEPFVLSRQAEGAPRSTKEPMPTQTAQHSPVLVTAYYGANTGCTSEDEPLPTVTTKDRFGIVLPVTHAGGEDRVRDANSEPLPTVTGANRGEQALAEGIVTPVFDGQHYDILFRMLEPHELAAAMGFTSEDQVYEFAGTKTEQIKQIGNAVSVAMMKAEVRAIMADAAPKQAKATPSRAPLPEARVA